MHLIVKLDTSMFKTKTTKSYCLMRQCPVNPQQIEGHKARIRLHVLSKEFGVLSYM